MNRFWAGTAAMLALALAFICVGCGAKDAGQNATAGAGNNGAEMNANSSYDADQGGRVDENGANPGGQGKNDAAGSDAAEDAADDAGNVADDAANAAKGVANGAKGAVTGAADAASDAVNDVAQGAADMVNDATGR